MTASCICSWHMSCVMWSEMCRKKMKNKAFYEMLVLSYGAVGASVIKSKTSIPFSALISLAVWRLCRELELSTAVQSSSTWTNMKGHMMTGHFEKGRCGWVLATWKHLLWTLQSEWKEVFRICIEPVFWLNFPIQCKTSKPPAFRMRFKLEVGARRK